MKISLNTLAEKIIWLLTVFLFASFLIFDTYTWGRYAFFGASVLIMLLSAVIHKGILRFRLAPFHIFLALFAAYVALTSTWALFRQDLATTKAFTLVQILACASMLYLHYDRSNDSRPLFLAVMWSGYVVVLYAISVYGLDAMLQSSQDIRLENQFANVNAIAMAAAISCMIQWHEFLNKRSRWSAILVIPAVILITATQSRKAFVMLLTGIIFVYVGKTFQEKGFLKKFLKLLLYMILSLVAIQFLLRLPIFSGALSRMQEMFNFWSGETTKDYSSIMRDNLIELGIEWFKKYPIGGVGIDNPRILAAQYHKFESYLHNNYVELLCGGGIIAFALYYSMYFYLFVQLFKYRKADYAAFTLAAIWLAQSLIMHYGMVAYYTKLQWYYLLIHFLNVAQLKRKYMEMIGNAHQPTAEGNQISHQSRLPLSH